MSGVYLTRRDPTRNLARFYRMLIVPTLFGEWVLLREWGRIGSGGTVRADAFPRRTEPAAMTAFRKFAYATAGLRKS